MDNQYKYRGCFEDPPPSLVGLKILVIRGDYWNKAIGEVSRELLWLCWFGIELKNLPSQLSLKNLRVLQLRDGWYLEELWDDNNAPVQLRELFISDCYQLRRFPDSIGCLRELKVDSKWEMPAIESLQRMEFLRRVDFIASDGSAIPRCIQTIQKLPGEIMIYARAVPNAASLVNSSLPPDLLLLDFISDHKIGLDPTLVQNSFSPGDTLLICFIIDRFSSTFFYLLDSNFTWTEQGKWVWVFLCTQRSNGAWLRNAQYIAECTQGRKDYKVERGLLVRGEDRIVVKDLHSLVPALIATSTAQTLNSVND